MARLDAFRNTLAARALSNILHRDGVNATVGTTWEIIWAVNAAYTFLVTPATLYIGSSSAADTGVSVTVKGLGPNYAKQEVTVALDGTDPQATQVAVVSSGGSETWLRINEAIVTTGTAAGNIHIADELPATWTAGGVPGTLTNTVSYIAIADQRSKQAVFTAAKNEQGSVFALDMTNNSAQATDFRVRVRPNGGTFVVEYSKVGLSSETFIKDWFLSLKIPPRADVIVEAQAQATTADVACDLEIIRH